MARGEKMGAEAIVRGRQICLVKMPEALQRNIREAFPGAHSDMGAKKRESVKVMGIYVAGERE